MFQLLFIFIIHELSSETKRVAVIDILRFIAKDLVSIENIKSELENTLQVLKSNKNYCNEITL